MLSETALLDLLKSVPLDEDDIYVVVGAPTPEDPRPSGEYMGPRNAALILEALAPHLQVIPEPHETSPEPRGFGSHPLDLV